MLILPQRGEVSSGTSFVVVASWWLQKVCSRRGETRISAKKWPPVETRRHFAFCCFQKCANRRGETLLFGFATLMERHESHVRLAKVCKPSRRDATFQFVSDYWCVSSFQKCANRRGETLLFGFVTSMERHGSDEGYSKVCKWLRRGVSFQVVWHYICIHAYMHTYMYTYTCMFLLVMYAFLTWLLCMYAHMFRLRLFPPGCWKVLCIIVAMSVITFSKSESVDGNIGRPYSMNMKCPHKIGRDSWVWDGSDYIIKKKNPR